MAVWCGAHLYYVYCTGIAVCVAIMCCTFVALMSMGQPLRLR